MSESYQETNRIELEPFLQPLSGKAEAVRAVVEPALRVHGLELVQLFLVRAQHRDAVRLFVEKKVRNSGGVSMEELERASRLLSDLLDVEDQQQGLFGKPYDLEVGSPGLDRPLTKKSHFLGAVGERVKVRVLRPIDGMRACTGTLVEAGDDACTLRLEGHDTPLALPYADIAAANVVFQFETPTPPGGAKPRGKKGKQR
ncbi:MAG: ribosome maturation factor RimP [Deltaproteobacteria bacterium]|nr:ribosome maturation factor RimP [Deltaproteobacteria bacterium]